MWNLKGIEINNLYKIKHFIEKTSYCEVYSAIETATSSMVNLSVYKKSEIASDDLDQDGNLKEIQFLEIGIDAFPKLKTFGDFEFNGETFSYIATEFIVGESLSDRIKRTGALDEYDTVKYQNKLKIVGWEQKKLETDNQKNLEIKNANISAASLDGLMARLKVVDELAKGKDEDGNVNEEATPWIIIFITLLFMAIELTPIFFKMMLIKSPYDYLEDNIKALQRADLGIEVKYDYYEDKEGVQRNLVIYHQANKLLAEKIKIAQTQTELNDFIIEKWKDQEKKNISKNPENFIDKG